MDVQSISRILTRKVGSVVGGGIPANETPNDDSKTDTNKPVDKTDSFSSFMNSQLKPLSDGTVSEEMLFNGIVKQRLFELKGEEGVKRFDKEFAVSSKEYRSLEEATKYALMRMQESKYISYEQGHKLHAEAFAAAQLDSNKEALYDHKGGVSDPTKAVMEIEKAIASAKTAIAKFDEGSKPLERPVAVSDTGIENINRGSNSNNTGKVVDGIVSGSIASIQSGIISPKGTTVDGSGGFLFKPVTENERRLAVLSPDLVGPMVKSIRMLDSDGNLIEQGRFTSLGDDGRNRAKFAFRKQGNEYPKDISVEIEYVDGKRTRYSIPDPSKRYD